MSDGTGLAWLKALGGAGVITLVGHGLARVWRHVAEGPVRREAAARARAARDAAWWQEKYFEVAAELKANTDALLRVQRAEKIAAGAAPESLPPPREELPTLQCFVEGPGVRAWAEEYERSRATPLNGPETPRRRAPPLHGVRVIETYSPTARPTLPAPPGHPAAPVSLAPPFPPPARTPGGPPRPPRPRRER